MACLKVLKAQGFHNAQSIAFLLLSSMQKLEFRWLADG
jgi:hypothetical protein